MAESAWHQEIIDLHEFFQDWLGGVAPSTNFDRLERSLDEAFTIVMPEGTLVDRPGILHRLREAP